MEYKKSGIFALLVLLLFVPVSPVLASSYYIAGEEENIIFIKKEYALDHENIPFDYAIQDGKIIEIEELDYIYN